MPDNATVISQTQKWLSSVVIKHNLCPFAKKEYDNDRIHYSVVDTGELELQLEQLVLECKALDSDPNRETSLLVFPKAFSKFEDYLNLLDIAAALLRDQSYEGVYQLASFHPNYRFEDSGPDDPSNYTNRSPYPMLHILREASVERAVRSHPNPERIPERNIKFMRDLGLEAVKSLLKKSYG